MGNTSNLDIISSNPVKDGLCAFRRLFESTRVDLGVVESSNTVQAVLSAATVADSARIIVAVLLLTNIVAKNLVLDLILAL
jgi:hypothetical protein